jgi:hypothetical protein
MRGDDVSGPVRAETGAFFLTAMVALIDDRLASARGRSAAALRDLDAGDVATGLERLRQAEPALAELHSLVEAALTLGARLHDLRPSRHLASDADPAA